jgi:hypothetical protein
MNTDVLSDVLRVIEYHLVAKGAARGHTIGEPPIQLHAKLVGEAPTVWRRRAISLQLQPVR